MEEFQSSIFLEFHFVTTASAIVLRKYLDFRMFDGCVFGNRLLSFFHSFSSQIVYVNTLYFFYMHYMHCIYIINSKLNLMKTKIRWKLVSTANERLSCVSRARIFFCPKLVCFVSRTMFRIVFHFSFEKPLRDDATIHSPKFIIHFSIFKYILCAINGQLVAIRLRVANCKPVTMKTKKKYRSSLIPSFVAVVDVVVVSFSLAFYISSLHWKKFKGISFCCCCCWATVSDSMRSKVQKFQKRKFHMHLNTQKLIWILSGDLVCACVSIMKISTEK